jgi:uncharacterized protein (DUF4415 family)
VGSFALHAALCLRICRCFRASSSFRSLSAWISGQEKQTTVRIDADVPAWLKSKGAGHIGRVNKILRKATLADLDR